MSRRTEIAYNPDYAVAEFDENARQRVRRRTLVLEASENKADSVKSATPRGFKYRKIYQNQLHLLGERFKYICEV